MAAGDSLRYRTRTMVPSGPPETYGSRTMTLHPEDLEEGQSSGEETSSPPQAVGTLKLRGGRLSGDRKVKWDENVVDNEGMGKKKSKICCIYHRPKSFDESSDEDSSSCSDDSDHDDHDNEGENSHHSHNHHRKKRSGSPNAYERQPQYKGMD
ncbi:phosphatase inhibitor-domain-containing protein [Gigaspora rosea]|uniref:Type 1 phosphatases regulator n=1 Tax=Gigaspora rosea TaxID=44941 RepID=A0A397UU41_9GLOM|nr:phosphatase inhibitor-domain-containing protein [Gigaspora rosea]